MNTTTLKKYKLYSEFRNITLYGNSPQDALIRQGKIQRADKMERINDVHGSRSVVAESGEIINISKIIGVENTDNCRRGNDVISRVLVEYDNGKIVDIDMREERVKIL